MKPKFRNSDYVLLVVVVLSATTWQTNSANAQNNIPSCVRALNVIDANRTGRALATSTAALRSAANDCIRDGGGGFGYALRGKSYYQDKDYADALTDYTEAIKLRPDGTELYNSRGNIYFAQGQFDRAITDFTEAIALPSQYGDRFHADVYINRAQAYEKLRDLAHAIDDYQRALVLDASRTDASDALKRLGTGP